MAPHRRIAEQVGRRAEEVWRTSNAILEDLREGRLAAEEEPLEWRLRKEGIPFREGAQMIRRLRWGRSKPARWRRARA
jgi:hypothetical protein